MFQFNVFEVRRIDHITCLVKYLQEGVASGDIGV